MKNQTKRHKRIIIVVAMLAVGYLVAIGCSSMDDSGTTEKSVAASKQPTMAAGAQAWANNCMRCHNMRYPPSLSDAQWDVAIHHMRVRANLLPAEHEAIVRYLKSAN